MNIYNEEKKMLDDFEYWSNGCGDLFCPDGGDLNFDDLPLSLQRVYNDLWEENKENLSCFLAKYKGDFGITLEFDIFESKNRTYDILKAEIIAKILEINSTGQVIFYFDHDSLCDNISVILFHDANIDKEVFDKEAKFFGKIAYRE